MKKRLSRRNARSSWRWGRGFRRKGLPFCVRPFSLAHSAHAEHAEGLLAVQAGDGVTLFSMPHQPQHLAYRIGWVDPRPEVKALAEQMRETLEIQEQAWKNNAP